MGQPEENEVTKKYICIICGKEYNTMKSAEIHLRIEHGRKEKSWNSIKEKDNG